MTWQNLPCAPTLPALFAACPHGWAEIEFTYQRGNPTADPPQDADCSLEVRRLWGIEQVDEPALVDLLEDLGEPPLGMPHRACWREERYGAGEAGGRGARRIDMPEEPDQIHAALKAAIEVETHDYLWTPSDGIDFVPRLCDKLFGDGRALLRLTTINSRPRYYVLRIDSRWDVEDRDAPDGAYDLREALDEIYQVLGEQFGLARDEDEELDELSAWPAFDHDSGASWRRMSWPELAGATFEPHPFAPYCNLLVT